MYKLKSIKLYFFSILKLFFLSLRNFYFKSNFYNRKLITFIPERIFYNPSTYLSSSLSAFRNDFYKITDTAPELLWKTKIKNKQDIIDYYDRKNEELGSKLKEIYEVFELITDKCEDVVTLMRDIVIKHA